MKTLLFIATIIGLISSASAFDHKHTDWNKLTSKHVKTTGVDYPTFKKDHAPLKSYLKELAGVSKSDFKAWNTNERLAFLINLYNAATIHLVLEHYPIKSFKDEIGGKKGPWDLAFVKAFGKTFTLNQVEHELIRKNFAEPRIHFAVNCASVGCPPLRNEAFTAKKLDTQLQEQTNAFFADKSKNHLKGKTLSLSPIFDWYKEDFIKKSGSVEAYANPYFKNTTIKKGSVILKYTHYDWNLNKA